MKHVDGAAGALGGGAAAGDWRGRAGAEGRARPRGEGGARALAPAADEDVVTSASRLDAIGDAMASDSPPDAADDVMTSAPPLEAVLGRAPVRAGGGEAVTRRLVAFGSLPARAGEALEACVERHGGPSPAGPPP